MKRLLSGLLGSVWPIAVGTGFVITLLACYDRLPLGNRVQDLPMLQIRQQADELEERYKAVIEHWRTIEQSDVADALRPMNADARAK